MEDADGVLLTYYGDGDGTGRLTVRASFDGFSGVGAAYFGDDQLLRFAELLVAFPLPEDDCIEVSGGFWSRTEDVLEEEHVGLRVLPVGRLGQVTIRTHLATPKEADAVQEVTVDVLTSYEALRRLSSDLPALVRGEVEEVHVVAERL